MNFHVNQKIRVTYKNGVVSEGTIVEVKSDRVRAIHFGRVDDGVGFGFAFRAIGRVITVEVI